MGDEAESMEAWVEGWQDAFGGGARKERVGVRCEVEESWATGRAEERG